jgi:membrane-associated phospholipid phosphatase
MNANIFVKFVIGYALVSVLTKVLKHTINQPRPIGCYESKKMCKSPGFPSGTGVRAGYAFGFAISTYGASMSRCQYFIIFLLTLLLCCGRVYMHSHSCIQVISGYILGVVMGMLIGSF